MGSSGILFSLRQSLLILNEESIYPTWVLFREQGSHAKKISVPHILTFISNRLLQITMTKG